MVVSLACSSPGAERDILHKHKVQTVPDTKRVSVDWQEHNAGSLLHIGFGYRLAQCIFMHFSCTDLVLGEGVRACERALNYYLV